MAAEESEALSVVGDMEECGDFGLVVDQTPPARPNLLRLPSGAGSTVVFAPPSVATDDLDPDETEEGQGQGEDGWDHKDPVIQEAAPNPQSGNEDEALVNEQLVDFIPPPNDHAPGGGDEDEQGGEPSTA